MNGFFLCTVCHVVCCDAVDLMCVHWRQSRPASACDVKIIDFIRGTRVLFLSAILSIHNNRTRSGSCGPGVMVDS